MSLRLSYLGSVVRQAENTAGGGQGRSEGMGAFVKRVVKTFSVDSSTQRAWGEEQSLGELKGKKQLWEEKPFQIMVGRIRRGCGRAGTKERGRLAQHQKTPM